MSSTTTTSARRRTGDGFHAAFWCCRRCVYFALFKLPKSLWKKWETTDILSYDARMRKEYNVRGSATSGQGYIKYAHLIRNKMSKMKNLFHRRGRNRSLDQDPQSEPSGFFKLPWELRSAIYSLAFPSEEIHVVLANQRLWGVDCDDPVKTWERCCEHSMRDPREWYPTWDELVWRCDCLYRYERRRNGCTIRPIPIYDPVSRAGVDAAKLLTVSKSMYQDVLSLLYGSMTLRFHTLPSLLLFAHSIPESQLMMVRKLHIDLRQPFSEVSPPSPGGDTVVQFPLALRTKYIDACASFPCAHHDYGNNRAVTYEKKAEKIKRRRDGGKQRSRLTKYPTQWAAACALLSTMTGLRHLRISLSASRMQFTLCSGEGGERQIFAPLAGAMKRLREKLGEDGDGRSCLRVKVDADWMRLAGGVWEGDECGNGAQELSELQRMGVLEGEGGAKCRECKAREGAVIVFV